MEAYFLFGALFTFGIMHDTFKWEDFPDESNAFTIFMNLTCWFVTLFISLVIAVIYPVLIGMLFANLDKRFSKETKSKGKTGSK